MKNYFQGVENTIPFKHVTCVQIKNTDIQKVVWVHMMVNTLVLYDGGAARFLEEYHAWLDSFDNL